MVRIKGIDVVKVCEKSAAKFIFGKKFSENAVKIILKKSKTKSRVILIFFFFGGGGIFLEVSAAVLINSIEHNYEQQGNKTSGKKVV